MFDQRRHDTVSEAADAAKREYDELIAAVHESFKSAGHVQLIGNWIDDIRGLLLSSARNAGNERDEAMWLRSAETTLNQVTGMISSLKADIEKFGGPANARLIGG